MSEEIKMREFDVNEVEPEDIIRQAREAERKATKEEREKRGNAAEKPKRDPLKELADLLDLADEEAEREIAKRKKQNLRSCGLFGAAAVAVIGCMLYGLADPMFALPLAAVYCMRGAVRYDRWARM